MGFKQFLKDLKVKKLISTNNCETIDVRWCTGGLSGGDCWGSSADYAREGENEPNFDQLDSIIKEYFPDVGYFKFKEFLKDNVEYSNYSENEYYGNSSNYTVKSIDLIKVFDFLVLNDKVG